MQISLQTKMMGAIGVAAAGAYTYVAPLHTVTGLAVGILWGLWTARKEAETAENGPYYHSLSQIWTDAYGGRDEKRKEAADRLCNPIGMSPKENLIGFVILTVSFAIATTAVVKSKLAHIIIANGIFLGYVAGRYCYLYRWIQQGQQDDTIKKVLNTIVI